jgi:hypothetical protein
LKQTHSTRWRQLRQFPLAAIIIEVIDPIVNLFIHLRMGFSGRKVDFIFHMPEEAFLHRIVPAVSPAAHERRSDASLSRLTSSVAL